MLKDAASTAIYGSQGCQRCHPDYDQAGAGRTNPWWIFMRWPVCSIWPSDIPMMNSREFVEKNYMRSFVYRTAAEGVSDINTVGSHGYEVFQDPEGNFYYVSKTAAYSGEYYRTTRSITTRTGRRR